MKAMASACTIGLLAATPAFAGQAASIPLTIGITASPAEVAAGGSSTVSIQLKNYRGDAVAAPENLTVTVHSELSGDSTIAVKAGNSKGDASVRFVRAGLATLVASAPGMSSGTASVVVRAGAPEAAVGGPPSANAATSTPAPAPVAVPTLTLQKTNLSVMVLPEHVHPSNASWQAKVLVTAVDENGQPTAVDRDTSVQLASDLGTITPAFATIAAGHARTTEQIEITSNKAGAGVVWAWTDIGTLGRAAFEDHLAEPTQLAVKALPIQTVDDGRTAIHVDVFLEDELSTATKAEDAMQVQLTSSIGTLTPSILSLNKGDFVGEAVLTSATAGSAEITATAAGLRSSMTTVIFVFPYALVAAATLGGLIGALVRSTGATFTGTWWWHLAGSLGIGAVLGLVFYALALFGIIALIPKVDIPLDRLPTTNELAALVLGFFGGYFARSWLPNPEKA